MKNRGDGGFVRRLTSWCAAVSILTATPAWAQQEEEEAEEEALAEQGNGTGRSLAERVPAVSGRLFRKRGRVEISPLVGMTFNDPFYTHIVTGGAVAYHILESLSVAASGEAFLAVRTPVQVSGGGNPRVPSYNRPVYSARLDVAWAPIYGKLSLLAEDVLHFDTFIAGSAGVVGLLRSLPTFSWGAAVGQHYYVNRWLAVRLEVRTQFFQMARQPSVDTGKQFQALFTGNVGLSFFLPTELEPETL